MQRQFYLLASLVLVTPELVAKRLFCTLGFLNKRTSQFSIALKMNNVITMQNFTETYSTGCGTKHFEIPSHD